MIGKVFKNGVIWVLFKTKLVQENDEIEIREGDEYQPFNIEVVWPIVKGTAIACCNALVEENYIGAYWIIVDNRNKYSEKKLLSSNEWDDRMVI